LGLGSSASEAAPAPIISDETKPAQAIWSRCEICAFGLLPLGYKDKKPPGLTVFVLPKGFVALDDFQFYWRKKAARTNVTIPFLGVAVNRFWSVLTVIQLISNQIPVPPQRAISLIPN
jgi:hypothetical protein